MCAKQSNVALWSELIILFIGPLFILLSPDLEVFEALSIHFVEEEVWQLLAQLVKAEEEALYVAELQFGLLARRVLSILYLFWWQRHKLLHKQRKHEKS